VRYVDPTGHQSVDPNALPDDVVDRGALADQWAREIREKRAQEAASNTAPTAEVVTEEDSDSWWQRALDAGASGLGWAGEKVDQAGDAVTAWFKKKWRTDEQPDAHKASNAKAIEGVSGTATEADRRLLAKDNTPIQEGLAEHAGQTAKETIYQQGLPAAAGALKITGKGTSGLFRRISSKGDDVFETISSRRLFERLRGANLDPPNNFPGIDRVNRGRAAGTSLKTIDLTSKRAANPDQFRQVIRDYVDDVRSFEGPEARHSSELGQLVEAPKLRARRLELGVQAETLTDAQRKIIVEEARRAVSLKRNPVELRVFEIVKE